MVVIEHAYNLDDERTEGRLKGPMHGIPVLVSDAFSTHPNLGMENISDTHGPKEGVHPQNALVIDLLLEAGMIIIGKVKCSLRRAHKESNDTAGWSTIDCMAPIVIGSMSSDTIVERARRAALYGLTTTAGSFQGVDDFPESTLPNGQGAMAKTPQDLAVIVSMLTRDRDLSSSLGRSWKGLKVGFVEPQLRQTGVNEESTQQMVKLSSERLMSTADKATVSRDGNGRVQNPSSRGEGTTARTATHLRRACREGCSLRFRDTEPYVPLR